MNEICAYSNLVTTGSYFVVEDTGNEYWSGSDPNLVDGIKKFCEDGRFEIDRGCEFFGLTCALRLFEEDKVMIECKICHIKSQAFTQFTTPAHSGHRMECARCKDAWIVKKLDRKRRLEEHWQHLYFHCPDFLQWPSGVIVDIGLGCELLEIARHFSHSQSVLTLRMPMTHTHGSLYVAACRLLWSGRTFQCCR